MDCPERRLRFLKAIEGASLGALLGRKQYVTTVLLWVVHEMDEGQNNIT